MFFLYSYRNWESELHNDYGTAYNFEKFKDETEAKDRAIVLENWGWHVTLIEGTEISFKMPKKGT